ncbi:hypothetical protein [Nisaea sp.]|uniref:hypothetical protein n=1 Tax=Nisaea sp. TaxID=2024842 RepID=UPI003B52A4C0
MARTPTPRAGTGLRIPLSEFLALLQGEFARAESLAGDEDRPPLAITRAEIAFSYLVAGTDAQAGVVIELGAQTLREAPPAALHSLRVTLLDLETAEAIGSDRRGGEEQ